MRFLFRQSQIDKPYHIFRDLVSFLRIRQGFYNFPVVLCELCGSARDALLLT